MSNRAARHERLVEAAAAAVAADAWIGHAQRRAVFATLVGAPADQAHYDTLSAHDRVRRRLPSHTSALVDRFDVEPALQPWLTSPGSFVRFIQFTGAAAVGHAMTRLVRRADVAALVAGLGPDVWRFGLAHATSTHMVAVQRADDLITTIEYEGCNAVFAYLDQVSPELASSAFDAADISREHLNPPQQTQHAEKAVQAVLEHASP